MAEVIEVALVAERHEEFATEVAALLRRDGLSVEVFSSGSPRKRFSKAQSAKPTLILSVDQEAPVREGKYLFRLAFVNPETAALQGRVSAAIERSFKFEDAEGLLAGGWRLADRIGSSR